MIPQVMVALRNNLGVCIMLLINPSILWMVIHGYSLSVAGLIRHIITQD
jgi:hypothetical protein